MKRGRRRFFIEEITLKLRKIFRPACLPLSCCLLVCLLFRFVLFLGYVPTASMEPAIPKNSFFIASRIYGELHRGDIVVFEKGGRCLVKRIAAVPGDTVYIDDQTHFASVNIPIEETSRILKVPEGSYFMIGDNTVHSVDSRDWEEPFVSENNLIAVPIIFKSLFCQQIGASSLAAKPISK